MGDLWLRLGLIVAVLAVAALVGYVSRRQVTYHPPLDLAGASFQSGIVVFTSTECRRCKEVLAVAKATGAPLREVTYELEPALQEQLGVAGVPLTLVIDAKGQRVAQFAGPVRPQRLRRALRRAGI